MSAFFQQFTSGICFPEISNDQSFQDKINNKTKPLGSLGILESLAIQLAQIQQTEIPEIILPHILVFAADHGIAAEGVSAFPQEVTYQMVYNFLSGGAAINVLCDLHHVGLTVIDAGVNHTFEAHSNLLDRKVGFGTSNFLNHDSMNDEQLKKAIEYGTECAAGQIGKGSNLIGFGEMGIANTSSASILCHILTGIQLFDLIGAGTGLHKEGQNHKFSILNKALQSFLEFHQIKNESDLDSIGNVQYNIQFRASNINPTNLNRVIRRFAGFEILMMSAAMLETARLGCTVLVDGFISTAAYLLAFCMNPDIKNYSVFSHLSNEKGHKAVLMFLNAEPVLRLGLRLGEGSGAAMAVPVLRSACAIMNNMASFGSAGISNSSK